jgi:hypothetical protein
MLIALATLLVCAFMFVVYGIVRTEERHLIERRKDEEPPLGRGSKTTKYRTPEI